MKIPESKFLKDYCEPSFFVDTIDLHVEIYEEFTTVKSFMKMRKNLKVADAGSPLILDGSDMEILSVFGDNALIRPEEYRVEDDTLIIHKVPEIFTLEITTKIKPQENTSLEGFYKAENIYLTQCEAEGFRKITYYPDRPDVMAKFTCTIVADKTAYPVLLSNGNQVKQGDLEDGRHYVKWEDPFRKPAYLFALVAGNLASADGIYTTCSGREIKLKVFVEKENLSKCDHTLNSLKKAMRWDEETYGLEYDLDIYMIVATNYFNFGAMENKGLNIFNSAYVLADPETATDDNYSGIESVVAHEYFHNWTGNRVTLNSWFQLSLKEGLTVFRDNLFSEEMNSEGVVRVSHVRFLKAIQFAEDAGPMAHPIRPESYIEIDNFYTSTVYSKGSEVIRMIYTLLGEKGFRKGMDLYFKRHDGKAVTTEDFVKSMEDATETDLSQFRLWYSYAGTPEVTVTDQYDDVKKEYTLTLDQFCPDTPDQKNKKSMHIPVRMGLLGKDGKDLELKPDHEHVSNNSGSEALLNLKKKREVFRFSDIDEKPIPSLLRGFSAPVHLKHDLTGSQLSFLVRHDRDPYVRWNACQKLYSESILEIAHEIRSHKEPHLKTEVMDIFRSILESDETDKAFLAEMLILPSEGELCDKMKVIDVDSVHKAREFVLKELSEKLNSLFIKVFHAHKKTGEYSLDKESVGFRKLKNRSLFYMSNLKTDDAIKRVKEEFENAGNMTDEFSALGIITHLSGDIREKSLDRFYQKWKKESLVLNKWFSVQAISKLPGTLENVKALTDHPDFSLKEPNKVRALLGSFFQQNLIAFHDISGEGYRFLAEKIATMNSINPSIAAGLAKYFTKWKRFDDRRQSLMKEQMERVLSTDGLSKGVYEIISKSLM